MKKYHSILLNCPLFAQIKSDTLFQILYCLKAKVKPYIKNQNIFTVGDHITDTGILLTGQAQIIYEDIFGNRSILGALNPGELFGEAFSCTATSKLPVSVVALTDCDILFIDYQRILTTCPSSCAFHHQLIENMVQILANKNVLLNQKIRYLSKRTTREKLLCYLSDQAKAAESRNFTIPFQRQELADFLCVERSAMSSELGKLKKEGLIDFHRSHFCLLSHSIEP